MFGGEYMVVELSSRCYGWEYGMDAIWYPWLKKIQLACHSFIKDVSTRVQAASLVLLTGGNSKLASTALVH